VDRVRKLEFGSMQQRMGQMQTGDIHYPTIPFITEDRTTERRQV